MSRSSSVGLFVCLFVLVAGCGDDGRAPPPGVRDAGPEAGRVEAGSGMDAGDAAPTGDAGDDDGEAPRCSAGQSSCTGPSGVSLCTDRTSDPANCGACGTRCPAGGSCTSGACTCSSPRMPCADFPGGPEVCTDRTTSVLHCGSCGNRCMPTFDCRGGACVCPAARTLCDGTDGALRCADLTSDSGHCGRCGHACTPPEVCMDGACADTCASGLTCTSDADCGRAGAPATLPSRGGALCLGETTEMVSEGGVLWTESRWSGGYCLASAGVVDSPGTCDPHDGEACDACSDCRRAPADPAIGEVYGCFRRCDLDFGDWRTTRSGCRDGYRCDLEDGVCLPGCTSDTECRSIWLDEDEDGHHDSGETTIDVTSSARCDGATGRCVDLPFTSGVRIGDSCTLDRDCGAGATCHDWEGGYCTQIACLLPGRECPAGDLCHSGALNPRGACLRTCTVGDETEPQSVFGTTGGDPDCERTGYRCSTLDSAAQGGCEPGNYNPVSEPNVGNPCENDEDCWSPFGLGDCRERYGTGYCTVLGCAADPFVTAGPTRSTLCPEDTVCLLDSPSQCLRRCDPAAGGADCPPDFVCQSLGEPAESVCFPRCHGDFDCHEGRVCRDDACVTP